MLPISSTVAASLRTVGTLLLVACALIRGTLSSTINVAFTVNEETPIGTKVYDLSSGGRFPPDTSFDGSGGGDYFEVSASGEIRVNRRLDRENNKMCPKQNLEACKITFVVLAGAEMSVVSVSATIEDINDHAPSWGRKSIIVAVSENEELQKRVPFQMAKDPDLGKNSIVSYKLVTPSDYFKIITTSGFGGRGSPPVPQLVVKGNLDREWQAWHNLTVLAEDGSPPFKQGRVQLNLQISDENDNTPVFKKEEYRATVDEDAAVDSVVVSLEAEDRDEGVNAEIHYRFAVSTPDEVRRVFLVDDKRGQVRVKNALNYEVEANYEFQVIAQDSGSPPRSASTRVSIQLRDKNDHKPTITAKPYPNNLQNFQVPENEKNGTVVAAVTVKDADSGRRNNDVNCTLAPMKDFSLEFLATSVGQKIYRIRTTRSFDREAKDRYVVTVTCWDAGTPPLQGYEDLDIRIVDKNDCAPQFRPGPHYRFDVDEGNAPHALVANTRAFDGDEGPNAEIKYSLVWDEKVYGSNPFVIRDKGQIFAKRSLDRETNPAGFRFKVLAVDQAVEEGEKSSRRLTSTATVMFLLRDKNDNAPRFDKPVYNFKVKETVGSYYGAAVGTVNATDLDDGPNGRVMYRMMPTNSPFSMQPRGQIFTRQFIDREKRDSYSVQVLAIDMADPPSERHTATVPVHIEVIDVNDNAPVFIYPNTSNMRTRISYREPPGFRLMTVKAVDKDKARNARVNYIIISGNTYGVFKLDKDSGDLRVVRPMAKIPKDTMRLQVRATDGGLKPLFKETTILIDIDESEPLGLQGGGGGDGGFDLETNKLIIIIIVIATAIICAVLITAICFMARGTPCLFGVRAFASSGASHSRPEHVLVRPIQKTPMKSTSLQSLNTRPYTDPTVDSTTPEVRFETFLGPLVESDGLVRPVHSSGTSHLHSRLHRTHAEEVADSDGDSGRGGSVKYFTNPDAVPLERHTYNNGALYVTVRRDTLTSNVSTSLV